MIYIKRVTIFLLVVMVSACASKSGFEPYSVHGDAQKSGPMRYQLTSVDLSLSDGETSERYPGQEELQASFSRYLNEAIQERQLNGDGYQLSISLQWERRMLGSGDGAKDIFSSAVCRFESEIIQEGQTLASDQGDPLNADSVKYNHKNLLNNLRRIGDSLARTGDPDSEQRELRRCAQLIVERLPK